MFSPIEQFSIYPILQITNFSITLFIIFITIYLFTYLPSFILLKHFEYWYSNLINKENGIIFIIFTIWLIILFSNLIGMIPYSFTITAQMLLVLSISVPTFISLNLVGISHHYQNIFYLFLPAGVPLFLTPIISFIEMISYFIRVLSLTLRLSANLISGHILIKIILYALLSNFFGLFYSLILILIVILELLVAFLQAYVFILLLISYYQDIVIPH